MKTWIFWGLATVLLATIVHISVIMFAPMLDIGRRMAQFEAAAGLNTLQKLPPAHSDGVLVVEPSPDVSYAFCRFDLSRGPVRLSAPIPDTYWSVSVYASTGENVYTINDAQTGLRKLELLIVGPSDGNIQTDDAIVFESPSDSGLVIIRGFVPERSQRPIIDRMLSTARCGIESAPASS